jgi:hypothetical protein
MFVHVNEVKIVQNHIVGAIDLELIAVTNVDALIVEIDRFLQTM